MTTTTISTMRTSQTKLHDPMASPSRLRSVRPPLAMPSPLGIYNDRSSLFSNSSSFGFPSRLSSGANSLGALLQAIQRYREQGLTEDEIEIRIREEFPPVPRRSSIARSDVSGFNNL
ncbi:hypothetical protein PINS_up010641 [Pythium insidiosum]|nr:hypothetical protein PINS_up010641 [Pythium insidiosum]